MSERATPIPLARRRAWRLHAWLHCPGLWSARPLGVHCLSAARREVRAFGGLRARLLAPSDAGVPGIRAVEVRA
jgi:hypothetical protein